jgi:hypothetical protein
MGRIGIAISVILLVLLSRHEMAAPGGNWLREAGRALVTVFRSLQSILRGIIAGLLFIPTTIFDIVWGVRYLQEAHGFEYGSVVMRSAMVPLGWIIGCPLSGTATGVINFLNFTISALLGPVFGSVLMRVAGGVQQMALSHCQLTFQPPLFGVALAMLLMFFLSEPVPVTRAIPLVPTKESA